MFDCIVMVGTMGALTAAGAKATVQGTLEYDVEWEWSFGDRVDRWRREGTNKSTGRGAWRRDNGPQRTEWDGGIK